MTNNENGSLTPISDGISSPLGELSPEQFLKHYWQKKPCLIRNALPGFVPPLDGDDLAGLACEEMAESRLVTGNFEEQNWQLHHGPFDEETFGKLPESQWTLLVQDVEKHYPPLLELMGEFDFLPSWRLDDLMVSYAVPGGSVGPHVDQYDVFLYQATGQRLWKIAEKFEPELLEDCPVNVLRKFKPEKEWLLKPGDMLYLPPNVAHHGVAIDEGMTWSIGLRAPSAADLCLALGEALAEQPDGGPRYTDPALKAPERAGEIDAIAIRRMKDLLTGSLQDPAAFSEFLGTFITRFRLAQEPVSPDPDLDAAGLIKKLQGGFRLTRNPSTRLAWIASSDGATLFAAGHSLPCSIPFAQEICARAEPEIFSHTVNKQDLSAVLLLVNGGHLVLHHEQDLQ